jgi:hypothetical protein
LIAFVLPSCNSTSSKVEGVPSNLPNIPLYGSARTPSHNMQRSAYPFDSNGNYVTAWAAEGGSSAGPSDYERSRLPDRDGTPPSRRSSSSKVSKVSSSPPKKVASTTSSKKSTGSASSSSSSKKSTASSGGGGGNKVTVKSSDTLYGLARKYGTTVAKIKAANGLKGDSIRDGTRLTIP